MATPRRSAPPLSQHPSCVGLSADVSDPVTVHDGVMRVPPELRPLSPWLVWLAGPALLLVCLAPQGALGMSGPLSDTVVVLATLRQYWHTSR